VSDLPNSIDISVSVSYLVRVSVAGSARAEDQPKHNHSSTKIQQEALDESVILEPRTRYLCRASSTTLSLALRPSLILPFSASPGQGRSEECFIRKEWNIGDQPNLRIGRIESIEVPGRLEHPVGYHLLRDRSITDALPVDKVSLITALRYI